MTRVKRGSERARKRRKILELAKGYYGAKSRTYRAAKEQVMHSLAYAYRDRRTRKGNFRKLWITRINAASRLEGLSYSQFVRGLKLAGVDLDRKVLSDIAVSDPETFKNLVDMAKEKVAASVKS